MAAFIGIDLGTTYSGISYIDENGNPKINPNALRASPWAKGPLGVAGPRAPLQLG